MIRTFGKIAETPLSERLAGQIRQAIFTGQLKAGSKIPQDDLAKAFGVSRLPIREALAELSHEGLVTLEPRRGAFVAPLTLATIDESYAMRQWTESEAVRRSVPRLKDADLEYAQEALNVMEQADDRLDATEFVGANLKFHEILRSRCPWPKLNAWVDTLWKGFPPLTPQFIQHQIAHDRREHRALWAASRMHDGERAAIVMARHIGRSWASARDHFQALGWPELSDYEKDDTDAND